MEDWHDYEWREEQEEMDRRRKEEIWEKNLEDGNNKSLVINIFTKNK